MGCNNFVACHNRHLIICVTLSHLMQNGLTALHLACREGQVETVTVLLKNGASIAEKDEVRLLYVHDQCCVRQNGVSGLDRWFCRYG